MISEGGARLALPARIEGSGAAGSSRGPPRSRRSLPGVVTPVPMGQQRDVPLRVPPVPAALPREWHRDARNSSRM